MEYREGRCPKCGEVMQIPVGRERIICMFCGWEFSISESAEADETAYRDELARFQENAEEIYTEVEKTVKGFHRTEYADSFAQYQIRERENLDTLRRAMNAAHDREKAAGELAAVLVDAAKEALTAKGSRLTRESAQMTMNMYMVTFVLPALLSVDDGKLSDLADAVCVLWAKTFKKSNIQAADFHTLNEGFRRKLCYITTAVCEGLHKPQDCYELKVLRNYRDGYLASLEDGEALIEQYYDIAPTIVKRMSRRKDRETLYRGLYEEYIRPCIDLIEEGKNEECREKYQEMVGMLQNTYMQGDGASGDR